MISEAIFAFLTSDPDVRAIVGTRIYPGMAPQAAKYPLIQYFQVAALRLPVLAGRHDVKGSLIQFDCYAQQISGGTDHIQTVKVLAAAVEDAFENFAGTIQGTTHVDGCTLEAERELLEVEGTLARKSQDYQFWWKES